jgi:exopolysaccharide production protein ExoQ
MAPRLALLLTLLLIGFLLRRDSKEEPRVSSALWIPTMWLMINSSRQVSMWFDDPSGFSAQRLEDGSPIDKVVYSLLIIAGMYVLARRRDRVGEVVRSNGWILAFLLYEGLSVLWSDFPLVALKRWSKALGDPVMVLVLWTEASPLRAISATIKRCAYVLIPLSILFCKYYENLGRQFDAWGAFFYTGVATDKNMLGYLLFAFGLYFVAALIGRPGRDGTKSRWGLDDQGINIAFLLMIAWLFRVANCQTAELALLIGIPVILVSRIGFIRRHFGAFALAALIVGVAVEVSFSLSENLVEGAGRNMTFTGRTGLWETLLQEPINPIVGVGYASFWLGERLARFWAMYPTSPPIEAHDGYLEIYLNLGLIGLFLLAGVLWSGLRRVRTRIAPPASPFETSNDRTIQSFGLAFMLAYLMYNVTEATFQGLNPLFVIFMILAFNRSEIGESVRNRLNPLVVQKELTTGKLGGHVRKGAAALVLSRR